MIIIHAKGNKEIGIGNLSRCYELIKYLSKKHDVLGLFECDENLFQRYSQKNICRSKSIKNSLELISNHKNSIYLCDLVNPTKELSNQLRELELKKIFYFNGIENGFEPDILFLTNGFDYPFEEKGFKLYRGFKYYIIGKDIVENRPIKFTKKKQIKNVLICFGGADPAFFTELLTKKIEDTKYNYTIILGPAMSQERKVNIKEIQKENITYIDSPTNMMKFYDTNDLLITLGGMMTYEAMCLGIPVCGIRWSYLEFPVMNFAKKNMITDLGNIEESYKNMLDLDINKLNELAENSFNIIDGSALENIQKTIEKYL